MTVSSVQSIVSPAPRAARARPPASARLRAAVLLAGSVRPSPLRQSIGRSFLDLPLDARCTVLEYWCEQLSALAEQANLDGLAVRILVDRSTPRPRRIPQTPALRVSVEPDHVEYRGTGGLLHDLAQDYDDDDALLIANAAQLTFGPLIEPLRLLDQQDSPMSILTDEDGSPCGLKLARCTSLRPIAPVGFVDLKEQALPRISKVMPVRVVRQPGVCSMPIRTHGQYLSALREHHRRLSGSTAPAPPFDEHWRSTFAVVEPGASVHPSAIVHDSVVLAGATVGAGAVLGRTLVCPGAVVRQRRSLIDELAVGSGS